MPSDERAVPHPVGYPRRDPAELCSPASRITARNVQATLTGLLNRLWLTGAWLVHRAGSERFGDFAKGPGVRLLSRFQWSKPRCRQRSNVQHTALIAVCDQRHPAQGAARPRQDDAGVKPHQLGSGSAAAGRARPTSRTQNGSATTDTTVLPHIEERGHPDTRQP